VGTAGVKMRLKDISLTGRIIANFPEKLTPAQRINDELAELGKLAMRPEANIIKLPNISASIPQLKAAIKELQSKGYDVPNYPDSDATPADKEIRARYGKLLGSDGAATVLKAKVPLKAGEIIDASVMSRKALRAFFAAQIDAAKKDGILFSLHVKTTMMKISDPILFGHCVSVFFADVFEKHGATLTRLGVDPDNGVGDMLTRIETLPEAEKAAIKADIQ